MKYIKYSTEELTDSLLVICSQRSQYFTALFVLETLEIKMYKL